MLANGPVRIKDVCGKAGLGQSVVHDAVALDAALALEDPESLAQCGIVLEANLTDVVTYSVGSVQLGDESISYWGSQNLTTDHGGREVYGGSDLFVVRGDLDDEALRPSRRLRASSRRNVSLKVRRLAIPVSSSLPASLRS